MGLLPNLTLSPCNFSASQAPCDPRDTPRSQSRYQAHQKRFRCAQIEQIARAAFGPDFAIRKTIEIFLPVYSITVQNPDGSQMTSFWNAPNGKRISQPYLIE